MSRRGSKRPLWTTPPNYTPFAIDDQPISREECEAEIEAEEEEK